MIGFAIRRLLRLINYGQPGQQLGIGVGSFILGILAAYAGAFGSDQYEYPYLIVLGIVLLIFGIWLFIVSIKGFALRKKAATPTLQ